jgi:hypothetical protein
MWSDDTPQSLFSDAYRDGMTQATALLVSMRDEVRTFWDDDSRPDGVVLRGEKPRLKVFLSHSSKDASLAAAVVDLVKNALSLRDDDIRCTSVDGYKLPTGTPARERLRLEVEDSEVLIALFSHNALGSTFTLFEVGARWASRRPLLPVLAHGFSPRELPAPLDDNHAIALDRRADLLQLVEDIAGSLGVTMARAAAWNKYVDAVLTAATAPTASPAPTPASKSTALPELSPRQVQVLTAIGQHHESGGVDFATLEVSLRLGALVLRHELNELEEANCIIALRSFSEPTRYMLSDLGVKYLVTSPKPPKTTGVAT